MPGTIDCYVDCVSLYSFFTVTFLRKQKPALDSQDVTLNFHPMFLGGVMQGSGNEPPWLLPARAKQMEFDRNRAMRHFDTPNLKIPANFPINTLPLQRSLTFIKDKHSKEKFDELLYRAMIAIWEEGVDVSKPDALLELFGRVLSKRDAAEAVRQASTPEMKAKLTERTKFALDNGAYGAPWFWVTNAKGETEPFFGSDRFHHIWRFLGVQWEDMKLTDVSKL